MGNLEIMQGLDIKNDEFHGTIGYAKAYIIFGIIIISIALYLRWVTPWILWVFPVLIFIPGIALLILGVTNLFTRIVKIGSKTISSTWKWLGILKTTVSWSDIREIYWSHEKFIFSPIVRHPVRAKILAKYFNQFHMDYNEMPRLMTYAVYAKSNSGKHILIFSVEEFDPRTWHKMKNAIRAICMKKNIQCEL
jgi:hypothetical protein